MKKFMTGMWTDLILANYLCPKEVLQKMLPDDLEPDLYKGQGVFSAVGFTFKNVRFFGFKVPLHQLFGEINLRCYVKSKTDGSKGVLFIRELAPKALIACVAKWFYNEPFEAFNIRREKYKSLQHTLVRYSFKSNSGKGEMSVLASEYRLGLFENEFRKFIVDRYVAFVRKRSGGSRKYIIKHRPWEAKLIKQCSLSESISSLFPDNLKSYVKKPQSVYLIDGSDVEVYK